MPFWLRISLLTVCLAVGHPSATLSQSVALAQETTVPPLREALLRPSLRASLSQAASPTPALLREADARIDRYRKADVVVVVTGPRGKPLPNVQVGVEQTKHAFLFGCAALSLGSHTDAAQEATYQKRFADLFNFATILTYWQDTDPEPGRQNLEKMTAQAERLQKMGIRVKGHPLILAGACPRWVSADPDRARDLTRARIHDLVSRFKGRIDVWDVVGDATTAPGAQNGLGAWARKAGPATFTADALTWARESNPAAVLLYNDYKLDSDYQTLVQDVRKAGAPLDVLGLEAHMIGSEWPLEKVWDTAETFAKLAKPLHFSEVTVLSDDPKADHSKTWLTTPEGEQRQADYVAQLYTLLFSHPAVQGIGWWNFVDGDWDRSPAGFLRADLSAKPVYTRLHHLIKERWWTRADLRTDRSGKTTFRGFAGHYRITVQRAGRTVMAEADIVQDRPNTITLRMQ